MVKRIQSNVAYAYLAAVCLVAAVGAFVIVMCQKNKPTLIEHEHGEVSMENLLVPSRSQSAQDLLPLTLLNYKKNGIYLEIGCSDPEEINNTFILEKYFNWTGVSLEIDPKFRDVWNRKRCNPITIADALAYDYSVLPCDDNSIIDYLSLDIDERYVDVLNRIPFDKYRFRVITIEHDAYKYGNVYRDGEREFLNRRGYQLLCANVRNFEDWWVHPDLIDKNNHVYRLLYTLSQPSW